MWWVVTACLGLVAVFRAGEALSRKHCARTIADAVALAHVAHGEVAAGEFATVLGAHIEVLGGEPLVVRVTSRCGTAVSAASVDEP